MTLEKSQYNNKHNKKFFMDNNSNFFVQLPSASNDPRGFYKAGLVNAISKYPWLKVAGLDAPFTTNKGTDIRGIQFAGPDNLITFGSAKNHDINWVKRADYAREKGYHPVYDIIKDWNTVMGKLDKFATERKPRPRYQEVYMHGTADVFYAGGQRVEVYDNYIKVGLHIIPRNVTSTTYRAMPVAQQEIVRTVIVRFNY